MENNEELVEQTENTEELTAEEIVDVETPEEEPTEEATKEPTEETFTKEQVDSMIAKKLARKEAKMRKEFMQKYGQLETVVNAGLGTNSVEEATTKLADFYKQKGITIPNEPNYSDKDLEILAKSEADDIISGGYEDIVEEVDRLANIGTDNMSSRDKKVFKLLAEERTRIEQEKELASMGITATDLENAEFRAFESKLNPNLSLKEKYELYQQTKPKKENKIIGSLQDGATSQKKEYYTDKEINKMSLDDLDDDEVWEAVRKSMTSR